MPGKNRGHYDARYRSDAAKVRASANRDPLTRCWRCGLTLAEHAAHKTGRPPTWDAGHIHDGVPGSPLMPEASTCNRTAGAHLGHQRRRMTLTTSRRW